jgi:hypothetical protein
MTTTIVILALLAAILFGLAMVFRAANRHKWEKEQTQQQKQRQEFFRNRRRKK